MRHRPVNFRLNPHSPLANGLVLAGLGQNPDTNLYYDSSAGVTIAGNHGALTNFTGTGDWIPSEHGMSVDFDGTNDHVLFDASNGLKFEGANDSFTVSMWIKPIDQGTFQALMWIQDANDDMWRFLIWNDDTLRASLDAIDFSSTSTISYGVWQHVASVFDKNGNGQIYIGGVANGTPVALNNETMSLTTNELSLGWEAQSEAFPYDGQIAQVMVHARPLSAIELTALADPSNIDLRVGSVPLILPNRRAWSMKAGAAVAADFWYYDAQQMAVAS